MTKLREAAEAMPNFATTLTQGKDWNRKRAALLAAVDAVEGREREAKGLATFILEPTFEVGVDSHSALLSMARDKARAYLANDSDTGKSLFSEVSKSDDDILDATSIENQERMGGRW